MNVSAATCTAAWSAVQQLAGRFWAWRSAQQPRSYDDVCRIERPSGWRPDWRLTTIREYHDAIRTFDMRCRALDTSDADLAVRVDHRLLASAIARVNWELKIIRSWQRDPWFYVDQSIGVVVDLLLAPPPFDLGRRAAVIAALLGVAPMTRSGMAAGARTFRTEFIASAVSRLGDIGDQVCRTAALLERHFGPDMPRLTAAAESAAAALTGYREWLAGLPSRVTTDRTGPSEFQFFLSRVALLPYTPDDLVRLGRDERNRAMALEAVATGPQAAGETPTIRAADQSERHGRAEREVRAWYAERGLLNLPGWLNNYTVATLPDYLTPLSWLAVTDDLTSPSRLGENAVTYVPPPAADLPLFDRLNLIDSRLGILHEGCHYYQLAWSWTHPDPIRRHYYDSAANEGLAFYNEEMLMTTGLLGDSPIARREVHRLMRLRASRVAVDVRLATGELGIDAAARVLVDEGGLDPDTARQEAAFFAATPGQGLSYQVGKTQIHRLLADAATRHGAGFGLGELHDYLWLNGNVPLSLSRWEFLGLRDELDQADALAPTDDQAFGPEGVMTGGPAY
jgi:hypothetical protein